MRTQVSNLNSYLAVPSIKKGTFKEPIMGFHWTVIKGNKNWKYFVFKLITLWCYMLLHLAENFLTEIFGVYTILEYVGSSQKRHKKGSSE